MVETRSITVRNCDWSPQHRVYRFNKWVSLESAIEAVKETPWQEVIFQAADGYLYAYSSPALWPSADDVMETGSSFNGCGLQGTFKYFDATFNWFSEIDRRDWNDYIFRGESLGLDSSILYDMTLAVYGQNFFDDPDLTALSQLAEWINKPIWPTSGGFVLVLQKVIANAKEYTQRERTSVLKTSYEKKDFVKVKMAVLTPAKFLARLN